jgi:hypothetical protein
VRDLAKPPRFGDGVGHRLLAEDVLALLHGSHGDGCMEMVGRADDHTIDLLLLEQLAIVDI